jgi:lysine-specific permease
MSETDELLSIENGVEPRLSRKLTLQHIQMIAVGGTIGTGVFVGSGITIATAGPLGALIGYCLVSILVYTVMTSLGELATHYPTSGSFTTYAGRYVDDSLSIALGWSYWFQWTVSFPGELAAGGIIMSYWFPDIPSWIIPISILIILTAINLFGVRGFGESEYWLSLIKIIAILIFIVVGFGLDAGLLGEPKDPIWFRNWNIADAPLKNGILGISNVFLMAFFAFGGTELIGITAGETQDPKTTVPKAIKATFYRIFLFYILTIFILGLVIPHNDARLLNPESDVGVSPFTLVFEKIGIKFAAHLINAVLITVVLSAGNSALFAASRTLGAMSAQGKAPAIFGKIGSNGIPYYSILVTSLIAAIIIIGMSFGGDSVFVYLISITSVSSIITWMSIILIHWRFRLAMTAQQRDYRDLKYYSWLHPWGSIFSLVLGIAIVILQGFTKDNWWDVLVMYSGLFIFVGIVLWYKFCKNIRLVPLCEVDLDECE